MTRTFVRLSLALLLTLPAAVASAQIKLAVTPRPDPGHGLDPAVTEQVTLTEPKLKDFLEAYKALKAKSPAGKFGGNPADAPSFARSIKVSGQDAQKILLKYKFKDPAEFQKVGYSAALAYSVLQQGGKRMVNDRIDAARLEQEKTIEEARKTFSPEQIKSLEAALTASLQLPPHIQDVPDANVELITKYKDTMAKL